MVGEKFRQEHDQGVVKSSAEDPNEHVSGIKSQQAALITLRHRTYNIATAVPSAALFGLSGTGVANTAIIVATTIKQKQTAPNPKRIMGRRPTLSISQAPMAR